MRNRTFRLLESQIFFYLILSTVACGQLEDLGLLPSKKQPRIKFGNSQQLADNERIEGSYIVAFRSDDLTAVYPTATAEATTHYRLLAHQFEPESGVKSINFITAVDLSQPGLEKKSLLDALGFEALQLEPKADRAIATISRVDFTDEQTGKMLLNRWDQQGKVYFAEPNYLSRISQSDDVETIERTYEELENSQDYYKTIRMAAAWSQIRQSDLITSLDSVRQPVIAVIDSGVDWQHKALSDRIWQPAPNRVSQSLCLEDYYGCDTTAATKRYLGRGSVYPFATTGPGQTCQTNGGSDADKNCKHGTHVSGIIAADPILEDRIGGVCPVCQIMILKVVQESKGEGRIPDSAILNALKYVTLFVRADTGENLVRVVNSSFGKYQRSRSVALFVKILRNSGRGILVVGAAGNEDSMIRSYPAALSDAIAVSSVNADSEAASSAPKSGFSNFGPWVDIAAPGFEINSSIPGGGAEQQSGTSQAAPFVSGAIGLLLATEPDLTADEISSRLFKAANAGIYDNETNRDWYFPPIDNKRVPLLGAGIIDVATMIADDSGESSVSRTELNRVQPGCAIVGGGLMASNIHAATMLLALPLLFGAFLIFKQGRKS